MAAINISLALQLLFIAPNPGSNISHVGTTTISNRTQLQIESPTTLYVSDARVIAAPSGYVAYPDIGFAYKLHEEAATFPQAEEVCKTEGGHLATIDSAEKLGRAWIMIKSSDVVHVGIFFRNMTDWVSVKSGLPVDVPWGRGEPSGDSACVGIKSSNVALGNYACYAERKFVCELPIPRQNSSDGRC